MAPLRLLQPKSRPLPPLWCGLSLPLATASPPPAARNARPATSPPGPRSLRAGSAPRFPPPQPRQTWYRESWEAGGAGSRVTLARPGRAEPGGPVRCGGRWCHLPAASSFACRSAPRPLQPCSPPSPALPAPLSAAASAPRPR